MDQQYETPPGMDPEDLTGRYQARMLTRRTERPYVVVDTGGGGSIVGRAGEREPGYRSLVAAKSTARLMNRDHPEHVSTALLREAAEPEDGTTWNVRPADGWGEG